MRDKESVRIVQDMEKAISVMRSAGKWLLESGKKPSKWWQLQNLNVEFLLQYAKPSEFYVVLVNEKPAAATVLQINQNSQDWKSVDKNQNLSALYMHWLCVDHQFTGMGLPKLLVDFAEEMAKEKRVNFLRVDTNAEELKLRKIYENLGFDLLSVEQEDYRKTAFYQKTIQTLP